MSIAKKTANASSLSLSQGNPFIYNVEHSGLALQSLCPAC